MSIDDETIIAFVDGELPEAKRTEIARMLAADQALRDRVDAQRELRRRLSAAFDGALAEPAPPYLAAMLDAPQAENNVVNITERRSAKTWTMRDFGAMAASLAAGLLIGVGIMSAQPPLIGATGHGLVARGQLARALETQLASDAAGAVRIGLSFRAHDGGYCRTFELTRAASSGVACRNTEGWTVVMTAASGDPAEVRTASASAAVLQAVEAMIEGEPLDHAAEAQARANNWRE